ncbi:MAG: hypothetical protein O7D93_07790 [Acidobacteria bacterium]|nr:hypothetical protein [Acidobacteriota bacterium]
MNEKPRKNSRTKAAEKKKTPAGWKLTEEDRAFLRSCGISPD